MFRGGKPNPLPQKNGHSQGNLGWNPFVGWKPLWDSWLLTVVHVHPCQRCGAAWAGTLKLVVWLRKEVELAVSLKGWVQSTESPGQLNRTPYQSTICWPKKIFPFAIIRCALLPPKPHPTPYPPLNDASPTQYACPHSNEPISLSGICCNYWEPWKIFIS